MTAAPEDKNVLLLFPTGDPAFTSKLGAFRKIARRASALNYAESCHDIGVGATQRLIIDTVEKERTDAVILFPFASDFQIPVSFFARLRERTRVILWLADDPTYFDVHARYYAQGADLVVTNDPLAVCAYKRLGIRAVYNLDIVLANRLKPVETEKDIDVLFIGDTSKPGRAEYLSFLKENGVDLRVFGPGSPEGWVPFEKMAEFFCRSRIVLNFSRVAAGAWMNDDEPLLYRVRQNTGRPVEAALCGAFCLTEYSPALDEIFRPGEEVAVFHNKRELLDRVRHYLSHTEEREAIASRAHRRAIAEYEPEKALQAAVRKAFSALETPSAPVEYDEIYLSPQFRRKSVNSLTFSMFIMLRRGRLAAAMETVPMLFSYGPAAFVSGFTGGLLRAAALLAGRLAGRGRGKA